MMQEPASPDSAQAQPAPKKSSSISPNVIILIVLLGFGGVIFFGGFVAALVIPVISSAQNKAQLAKEMSDARQVAVAITLFQQEKGKLPQNLEALKGAGMIDANSYDALIVDPDTGGERWVYFPTLESESPLLISKKIFSDGGVPKRILVLGDSSARPIPDAEAVRYLQGIKQ
jgi:type II secretory pathway pseudopilin PulG